MKEDISVRVCVYLYSNKFESPHRFSLNFTRTSFHQKLSSHQLYRDGGGCDIVNWNFEKYAGFIRANAFRIVRKISKSDYSLRHVCLSVRLSAWNNSVPIERIFMKLHIWTTYINRKDAQNSCDYTLFFNIRSTCFGLY